MEFQGHRRVYSSSNIRAMWKTPWNMGTGNLLLKVFCW